MRAHARTFQGHVRKRNTGLIFATDMRSTKTEKFNTPRKFVPLRYVRAYHKLSHLIYYDASYLLWCMVVSLIAWSYFSNVVLHVLV